MKTTILLGTRKGLIAYQIKGNGKCVVENISFEGFPVSIANRIHQRGTSLYQQKAGWFNHPALYL
jgi:hypothetical protein